MELQYIYTHEDGITKSTKHSLKGEKMDRGNGSKMEGVNLLKVYGTYVWNYHNEPLPALNL
jgi:hypothetical protein